MSHGTVPVHRKTLGAASLIAKDPWICHPSCKRCQCSIGGLKWVKQPNKMLLASFGLSLLRRFARRVMHERNNLSISRLPFSHNSLTLSLCLASSWLSRPDVPPQYAHILMRKLYLKWDAWRNRFGFAFKKVGCDLNFGALSMDVGSESLRERYEELLLNSLRGIDWSHH